MQQANNKLFKTCVFLVIFVIILEVDVPNNGEDPSVSGL